jgi:rhamnosyltransferase
MQISIVIPTLNAGAELAELFAAIERQCIGESVEVVVVDSDSDDGTPELARRRGARVESIRREDFNHGATRNLGVELSGGDLVVLTTQDALPRGADWLSELVSPFEDPRVAGAYGRVVARGDASPLVARSVSADLAAGTEARLQTLPAAQPFRNLSSALRRQQANFNNVSSCIRRGVFEEFDFPAISFGEDLAWGLRVVESGRALVYQPGSVVEHSHVSSLAGDFRRHLADARLLNLLFDERPGVMQLGRSLLGEVFRDLESLGGCPAVERLRQGAYSPCLRSAQALGRWVGAQLAGSEADRAALEAWATP